MVKTFSVVITTYNSGKWIGDCLNSLINQNIGFEDNIEVVIVDNSSFDDTCDICHDFVSRYPNNILFIQNDENYGPGIGRNIGLKYVSGDFVNFLDSDDTISENTFSSVLKLFKNHENIDLVSIPIYFFENRWDSHYLNYKFVKTDVVNLVDNPDFYQLSGSASFIRKTAIKNIVFPDIITSEDVVFVNEILLNNPNIGLCCEGRYNYRKRKENTSIIDNSKLDKNYFTPRVKNYFKYLFDLSIEKYGCVLKFIQNVVMYDISWMLKIDNISEILNETEVLEFKYCLSNIIQFIDDDIIYYYRFIADEHKINLFLLKYGDLSNPIFSKFKISEIQIDIFNIVDDELYILAGTPQYSDVNINVYVNDERINMTPIFFPQRNYKFLDYTYLKYYTFEFKLPLNIMNDFKIEFKNYGDLLDINFARHCNFSKTVGYMKTKKYLSMLKNKTILVEKKTTFKWLKTEVKSLIHMLKNREAGYKVGIPFRFIYFLVYSFLRNKHIWFYMDRPEVSDDNGLYLFKYAVNKDEDIQKYFIINKNTTDYNEIKKLGDVLAYKSIKHRILGMFVENIITSHPDNQIIYPFWASFPHLAGILKSNIVFLQHGIIKDDISSWLNKYSMDLSFFLTSAPLEYESIFKYPYNYDENVVQLLGLPRYDTLKNNEDKKQIIIMPSWRRELEKKPAEYIVKTKFFCEFNSLINNKKLINYAKEHDYEIIFRPHPNVYKFINLFDKNDYTIIDYERIKYQTLFNNASLLITDYSSVAFDFSYLKKPILYYQYSDDYHFDLNDSYFDYETMGFGEIATSQEELVNLIIEYINRDCKIKNKYLKRIDEFFLYTDKKNCKRVHDAIKKIPLKD